MRGGEAPTSVLEVRGKREREKESPGYRERVAPPRGANVEQVSQVGQGLSRSAAATQG